MLKETKGYTNLRGKIWGLNKKEIYDSEYSRELSFGINTSKDNALFVGINTFKNVKNVYVRSEDGKVEAVPFLQRNNLAEGQKLIGVNIKSENDESTVTLCELDALKYIKDNFKDGMSIFVKCTNRIDAYRKGIKPQIQQIYMTNEPIDFDVEDFEEGNKFVQEVIMIDKDNIDNCEINVAVVDRNLNIIEMPLKLSNEEEVINFFKTCKKGDLIKVVGKMVRKPIYEDTDDDTQAKVSLIKKKSLGGNYGKKVAKGYDEYFEVYDVESREEKKYSREDFEEAEQERAKKEQERAEKKANKPVIKDQGDLPF